MRAEPSEDEVEIQGAFETLGVGPEAEARELRRAFRRQARALHPDVSSEPDAEERFKRLVAIYEVALRGIGRGGRAGRRARSGRRAQTGRARGWGRAKTKAAPPAAPPGKLECPCCGERYEDAPACFRCETPLWDGRGARPDAPISAAAAALEAKLAARSRKAPGRPLPSGLAPAMMLTLAVLVTTVFFFAGPLGMALMLAGYTAFLVLMVAVALQQERSLLRLGFARAPKTSRA